MLLSMINNGEDVTKVCTSKVTNMYRLLQNESAFNQNIGSWDVSNVNNMREMFRGASAFNQDISKWDVSNVSNMLQMFRDASDFDQNIADWNVAGVTNMGRMFFGTSFNQNINSWNVSNVQNMVMMFRETPFDQPLDNWDVANVSNMTRMFQESAFNQDISGWCVSLISSEPTDFSFNSPLINTYKPLWGTCGIVTRPGHTPKLNEIENVRIYPSPFSAAKDRYVNIEWIGPGNIDKINLIDVNGRILKVKIQNLDQNKIYFEMPNNISEGVYILQILNDGNMTNKRISVQD
jgi:surface protein